MWAKQCHKPPMTGNGKHSTCKNGDDWGMVQTALFSPHYMGFNGIQWNLKLVCDVTNIALLNCQYRVGQN